MAGEDEYISIGNGKKKKKIKRWMLIPAAFLVLSFLSFAGTMVSEKSASAAAEKKEQEKEDAEENGPGGGDGVEPDDNISYLEGAGKTITPLECVRFVSVKDSVTLRILVDGDEATVILDGIKTAANGGGPDVIWEPYSKESLESRLKEGQTLYLYETSENSNRSYIGYLFDTDGIDIDNEDDFIAHCVNAWPVIDGYAAVSSGSSSRATWLYSLMEDAQGTLSGMWVDAEAWTDCGFPIPEVLAPEAGTEEGITGETGQSS